MERNDPEMVIVEASHNPSIAFSPMASPRKSLPVAAKGGHLDKSGTHTKDDTVEATGIIS